MDANTPWPVNRTPVVSYTFLTDPDPHVWPCHVWPGHVGWLIRHGVSEPTRSLPGSVSAEAYGAFNEKKAFEPPVYEKSTEQAQR